MTHHTSISNAGRVVTTHIACRMRLLSILSVVTAKWSVDEPGTTEFAASTRTCPPQLNWMTPSATAISTVLRVVKTVFGARRHTTECRHSLAFDVPSSEHLSSNSGWLSRSNTGSRRSAAGSGKGRSCRVSCQYCSECRGSMLVPRLINHRYAVEVDGPDSHTGSSNVRGMLYDGIAVVGRHLLHA